MSQSSKRLRQDIHGIVLLNKPTGMSSNKALQKVKYLLGAKKAGHTGALDPLATGLLPLCFGQATKIADFLLESDKTYVVTAKLGERTTTSDAEGEIVQTRSVPSITEKQLNTLLQKFTGEISQQPSIYSALKYKGKPYYYYARKGIEIDRPYRNITIYNIGILNLTKNTFELSVHCSKGTYIRTLVDDLGEALGCGAHVTALHRESIAGIVGEMHSLETIEQTINNNSSSVLLSCEMVVLTYQYMLTNDELVDFKKGLLKQISCDATEKHIYLMAQQDHKLYGFASKGEGDHYTITKRFINGFGEAVA